jgi:hypothetical protein
MKWNELTKKKQSLLLCFNSIFTYNFILQPEWLLLFTYMTIDNHNESCHNFVYDFQVQVKHTNNIVLMVVNSQ